MPGVIVWPARTTDKDWRAIGLVVPSMTALEAWGCIEIVLPRTVIGGEPGTAVCPAMMNAPASFAVTLLDPTPKNGAGVGIESVLLPIAILEPPGSNIMGVFETVIMDSGRKSELPMTTVGKDVAWCILEPIAISGKGLG